MKTLLLTGFEPFLEHSHNPTEAIVKELDGKIIGKYLIKGRILPVVFGQSADKLLRYVEELSPEAVISLGLAAGRNKVTPERIAINVNDGVRDNSNHVPVDELIKEDGSDAYFTTLPIRDIVNNLVENGIPAEISNTAGTYLCNNVMYSLLHDSKQKGVDLPSGFIHIPASFELGLTNGKLPAWPLSSLKAAVEVAIKTLN
ncbi:pyroglutamyl-peptidase I [Rossellomorea vietnamensis]|uniref:Pyrrolidone-carboxylate peptidase n=1 Tax=Rossellomorea vietnamensis TaxID=218284 RepID=A0A5D4KFI9_9BACI|nr:pyroglutamyl-peptidase I [Rossellomorea vietnamensis]TYR75972.1 pyroglutamyl-peptidase I [Rossellomorea vietnamensis]